MLVKLIFITIIDFYNYKYIVLTKILAFLQVV